MNGALLRQPSEPFPLIPEKDPKQAPRRGERHICHERWNVASFDNPWSDEFTEAIAPQVFIDGNADEDRSCDGFVRINSIGRRDGRERGDLYTCESVADKDNDLLNKSAGVME